MQKRFKSWRVITVNLTSCNQIKVVAFIFGYGFHFEGKTDVWISQVRHVKELIKYMNILILPQENDICKLLPIALQLFCIQLVTCHPHRYSTHFEAWKLWQIMPLIDPNCHGIEWKMLWKFSFQRVFSEKRKQFYVTQKTE